MQPGATASEGNGHPFVRAVDPTTTQLLREYVAGGDQPFLRALKRALPQWIDDVTRDFGNDLYERMLRDPDVDSALDTLKNMVLSESVTLMPPYLPQGQEEEPDPELAAKAERSEEIKAFVDRRLKDMNPLLPDLCRELLDGLAFGHKAAEKVMRVVERGPDAGKLGYAAIKCRARRNLAFVVDAYGNVLGLLAIMPDQFATSLGLQTLMGDPALLPNFVPRNKFVLFQWDVKDGDPRGSSILRSSYNPWFMKAQVLPQYYQYLKQFAVPSLIGTTPPMGDGYTPKTNSDGTLVKDGSGQAVMISAEQAMLNSLLDFANGSAVVLKGGSEVKLVQSDGEGNAFLNAFEYFGRQIHLGILNTARATKEAQHGSKADSEKAGDVLTMVVAHIKQVLQDTIDRDIIRPLVEINFGPDAVEFMPNAVLSKGEKADKAAMIAAYGSVGYTLHRSQFSGIDRELDVPERDLEAESADLAHQQDMDRMTAGLQNDLFHPASTPEGHGKTPRTVDGPQNGGGTAKPGDPER